MTQFIVLSLARDDDRLKKAVEHNIDPSDRIEILQGAAWLVVFEGKAADLKGKLNSGDGGKISLFISSLTDISGYGPTSMIQWMDEHDRS